MPQNNIDPEKQNSQNVSPENSEGKNKETDFLEVLTKLWDQRKLILLWCMWGVLAGLIIAFSIPKEYATTVKLAPESKSSRSMTGGLGALASMAGISASTNTGSDAVYPSLYPEIVASVPFATSLFNVPVTDKEGKTLTVKEYLLTETKGPWWGVVKGLPGKAIGIFFHKDKKGEEGDHVLDNFNLTPEESALVGALRARVKANVDQKTNVITIETLMQDPRVSAILADTVVSRLSEYVTNYRTNKARQDLEYALKLNEEAREEYYKTQQNLADYIDRNQNLATRSAQVTQERLENESSLAFNLYNETSLQVQNAKSKVQETTPVYTQIMPATVPMHPISPKRGMIIGGCAILAFFGACAWILFAKPMVAEYKSNFKKVNDPKKD